MKRPLLLGLAVALLLAGGTAWYRFSAQPESAALLRPDDSDMIVRGAKIYAAACASCHGDDLEGQENWRERRADGRLPAPPHDASGHTWHHPDGVLFQLTKLGPSVMAGNGYESDMPGFGDTLTDEEIVAVLSYIKSRWPEDIRLRHDEINRQASQR